MASPWSGDVPVDIDVRSIHHDDLNPLLVLFWLFHFELQCQNASSAQVCRQRMCRQNASSGGTGSPDLNVIRMRRRGVLCARGMCRHNASPASVLSIDAQVVGTLTRYTWFVGLVLNGLDLRVLTEAGVLGPGPF